MNNLSLTPKFKKKIKWKEELKGWLCISPVVLGVLIFTAVPIVYAFITSFYETGLHGLTFSEMGAFVGLKNYTKNFMDKFYAQQFWQSMKVTFTYALINIPIQMVLGFLIALFLNREVKGIKIIRVLFYLPCLIPGVCSGVLWRQLTDPDYGVINGMLSKIGLGGWQWYNSAKTSMPSFIMTGLFGIGGGMILWLAQLKNIPRSYYESAEIDGAGKLRQLLAITIPMVTPMILYNVIMSLIGTLQTYDSVVGLVDNGGKGDSMLFYVILAYSSRQHNYGYSCALSFILFFITAVLSVIAMITSNRWVYYTEET